MQRRSRSSSDRASARCDNFKRTVTLASIPDPAFARRLDPGVRRDDVPWGSSGCPSTLRRYLRRFLVLPVAGALALLAGIGNEHVGAPGRRMARRGIRKLYSDPGFGSLTRDSRESGPHARA